MAFDAYIQIEGIPGEALDENHKDWIEVLGFELQATQATSATASSAGGGSSERVALSDFSIRKRVDKASAKLFEACCKGTHIPKIQLNVNRAGDNAVTYLSYVLEEVVVSLVKTQAGSYLNGENEAIGDLPTEEIRFNYAVIKTTYTLQNRKDGQAAGNVTGGWNRKLNKPSA